MALKTSIIINDAMTPALTHMNNALNMVLSSFEQMQRASTNAIDLGDMQSIRDELAQASLALNEMESQIIANTEEQENFNDSLSEANDEADSLLDKIGGIAKAYLGMRGIRAAYGFLLDAKESADIQNASEMQLQTVLNNVGAAEDAYDKLNKKASQIQASGIYGDEIMLGGAAELATYISDTNAIESMMDTLTNYAVGMSGGGELDKNAMVDYATQLGKALDGTFDGLTKKGFTLTDAQKEIIENGTDMEKALMLDDVISQSWDNLYETMSDTPEGQIIRLNNAWGDIKENVGNKVYPAILNLFSVINNNMPTIEKIVDAFATGMYRIINALSGIIKGVSTVANFIIDNWGIIGPIVGGIVSAFLAYNAVLAVHAISLGINAIAEGINTIMAYRQAQALLANVDANLLATSTTYQLAIATAQATVAQAGFNTVLMASPITWIIIALIAIIAIIYAVVGAINKATGSTISALGVIMGALATVVAFIWNLVLAVIDFVLIRVNYIANKFIAFGNFLANVFRDPVASIIHLFGDMADNVLGIIESIASAIDKVFGQNLAGAVQGWRNNLNGWIEEKANKYGNGSYEKIMDNLNLTSESFGLKRWAYSDAYNSGYNFGTEIENKFKISDDNSWKDLLNSVKQLDEIDDDITGTNDIVGNISDKLDATEEELKSLVDLAERETINRFTTAEIKIDFSNTNHIQSDLDLDGVVEHIKEAIYEGITTGAEEVHA